MSGYLCSFSCHMESGSINCQVAALLGWGLPIWSCVVNLEIETGVLFIHGRTWVMIIKLSIITSYNISISVVIQQGAFLVNIAMKIESHCHQNVAMVRTMHHSKSFMKPRKVILV